jgi:hypothetical protein
LVHSNVVHFSFRFDAYERPTQPVFVNVRPAPPVPSSAATGARLSEPSAMFSAQEEARGTGLRVTGPKLWGPSGLQATIPKAVPVVQLHQQNTTPVQKITVKPRPEPRPDIKAEERLQRERLARSLFTGEGPPPAAASSVSLVPSLAGVRQVRQVSDLLDMDTSPKVQQQVSNGDLLDI